jgi:phosphonate transport system permease protein
MPGSAFWTRAVRQVSQASGALTWPGLPPATRRVLIALATAAGLVICWRTAEIRPQALFDPDSLAAVLRFIRELFPPDFTPAFLPVVGLAIARTVAIAIAGTALSILVAFPLGVLSTGTLWHRGVLLDAEPRGPLLIISTTASRASRALLGFLRAVPDLMWGLLFVVAVGLGSVAGTLAVAVSYGGVLGRVYADIFEDVDTGPLEALHATGASRAQVFLRGIWPQAAPSVAAYTLYSFECCVRAASVLGFIGAGGLGYEISLSMKMFSYGQVLTLLLAYFGLGMLTDGVSRFLRRRLHANAPGSVRSSVAGRGTPSLPRGVLGRLSNVRVDVLILAAMIWSFYASGLIGGALTDGAALERMARFVGKLVPPDLSPAFLTSLSGPLLQTIGISVSGTILGIAVGSVLALPATSTLIFTDEAGRQSPLDRLIRWSAYSGSRLVLTVLRSIPELVWVLIAVLAVGLGPFAGTLALGLHTAGVLGKLYSETFEEVPHQPVEALRAAGARTIQLLIWAIWPLARRTLASYTVLRWEMNLRASTVLGLVGGGGLGQAMYNYVQLGFYAQVATLILIVYGLVVASDRISSSVRQRFATT